jgi:pilus assembly protein CpaB
LLKTPVVEAPVPPPAPQTRTVRVVQRVAARAPSNCVGVISGTEARQECF